MVDLPIEIIEMIGEKCDQHTLLNVCLASKNVYETNKTYLLVLETKYVCKIINSMLSECYNMTSKYSRIKCVHRIMRTILQFQHVLETQEKLMTVILCKIEQWSDEGMSPRKCKQYRKMIEKMFI